MKRNNEDSRALVAPLVRLNVGGVHFDTTRDTLAKASYWDAWLEGRIGHATDQDGRLFVDRDGKLFGCLLNFMRNRVRPANRVMADHKEALISECEFYGIDWMLSDLRGGISPYDMRCEDRLIRQLEMDDGAAVKLHDVFRAAPTPKPRTDLQMPLLMCGSPVPLIRGSYACFIDRLGTFTGGLLPSLSVYPAS